MAITLHGNEGGTASAGWYAQSAFTGTFSDGIVVDYTTGIGRITVGSADGLTVYNGGTGARSALLNLDSSGNMGLGVTPSAWLSGRTALDMGQYAYVGGTTLSHFTTNTYLNSSVSFTYKTTAAAAMYQHDAATHRWYSAPSGTAGTAITFTNTMTLDASGNLLLGTSTVGTSGTGLTVYNSSQPEIRLQNSTSGTGTTKGFQIALASSDVYLWNIQNGAQIFATNNTERARIDSSGNLLVGTTSQVQSGKLCVSAPLNSYNTATLQNTTTQSAGQKFMAFMNSSSAFAGSIDHTGSTTVAYTTSSDQRLKENIVDAPSAISSVNAIKVRSFNWKADGSHVDYGYIAQELLEIVPEAVSVPKDPEEMMGVDFGKLTPRIIKALQELTARLEILEAK